ADLPELVVALDPDRRLPGLLHGRQQQPGHERDDGQHDEQFEEGEPTVAGRGASASHGPAPGRGTYCVTTIASRSLKSNMVPLWKVADTATLRVTLLPRPVNDLLTLAPGLLKVAVSSV